MTDLDDLPWSDGSTPTRNGATGRPACRRHQWNANGVSSFADGTVVNEPTCRRCGAPRNAVTVRRGRNNRSRGNRAELTVARKYGGEKTGPLGGPEDIRGAEWRTQVKTHRGCRRSAGARSSRRSTRSTTAACRGSSSATSQGRASPPTTISWCAAPTGWRRSGGTNERPVLLDLFCGAGGAAMGYHRAGFDVVGVDINPQPHYPFEFIRYDLSNPDLEFDLDLAGYDAIHARHRARRRVATTSLHAHKHPRMIEPIRTVMQGLVDGDGLPLMPCVIENVERAPMTGPILCGSMFG